MTQSLKQANVSMHTVFAAITIMSAASLVYPLSLRAATAPSEPPLPSYRNIDANGVELTWGTFKEVAKHSSIGPVGSGGLARLNYSVMDAPADHSWGYESMVRDNYFGAAYPSMRFLGINIDGVSVKIGDRVEFFPYGSSSTTFISMPESDKGQSLEVYDGGNKYLYKDFDGTLYIFDKTIQSGSCGYTADPCSFLTKIQKPSGEIVNLYYYSGVSDCVQFGAACTARLKYVTNNSGYVLKYIYDGGGNIVEVTAANLSDEWCDVGGGTCANSTLWQRWTYAPAYTSGAWMRNATDPLGRTTQYRQGSITYPSGKFKKIKQVSETSQLTSFVETNAPVDFYVVRPSGTWKYARLFENVFESCGGGDGGSGAGPELNCYLAGTGPFTQVTDPLGHTTKFSYAGLAADISPNGAMFYPVVASYQSLYHHWYYVGSDNVYQNLVSITDALGRKYSYKYALVTYTDSSGNPVPDPIFGGIGTTFTDYATVAEAKSPEGSKTLYEYDARKNTTKKTFVSKDGSSTIVINWGYSSTCSNLIVCNQPNYVIDANGNRTDYEYDPVHGGVLTETGAADANGVHPQVRYGYTPMYAKVKDAGGNLVNAEGPIYKLTSTSTCRSASVSNPASCVGTANEQVTLYAYDSPNLLLTSTTVKAGDNSVSATISYGYDSYGNQIWVDGPRTDVDDKVYTTYDILRRPIFEIGVDPDGAGPLKRVMVRHNYDVDGNEALTETGTGYATNGSDFIVSSFKRMTYDDSDRLIKTEVGRP